MRNSNCSQTIGEGRVVVDDVLNLCDKYIKKCKKQIDTLNNSMEVDPEKQEYIKSHLLSALKDYPLALPIFGDINTDDYERMIINSLIKTVTELTKVAISTVYLQRNKV